MPPQGSVKREIGELPQMAQQEHGGNRGFRVFLYAPVVKHLFTGRAGRNLEVHATVVVGFVGGGEVEVGEQNLVKNPARLRRRKRDAGCKTAQFEHPVPDVTVLGQMRRSTCFTAAGYHLVERAAMGELWVEFPAEFTRPAGAGVEAMDDGWIDVFHEEMTPGRARTDSLGL